MSWHNLSEKEFDSKIKAHFEAMDIPFAQGSWDLLDKKLDTLGLGKDDTSNHWWLMGLILLSTGFFFWSLLTYAPATNIQAQNIGIASLNSGEHIDDTNVDQNQNNSPTSESHDPTKVNEIEESDITSRSTSQSENIAGAGKDESNLAPPSNAKTPENRAVGPQKDDTRLPNEGKAMEEAVEQKPGSDTSSNLSNRFDNQNDITDDKTESSNNRQTLDQDSGTAAMGNASPEYFAKGSLTALRSKSPELSWSLNLHDPKLDQVSYKEIKEAPVQPIASARWSIGLTYAPDVSLVGFSELTKPGINLGLSVDYRINQRWSIQTGAIVAKKNYIADGEDYSPPPGFWDYTNVPDQADATCTVIDIPISVRYYWGHQSQWYASTGLSTYLMLREDYQYSYNYNNPGSVSDWSVRNENQHFLGVYNLSMGYQKQIAANWYLEIEPFIKAPIAGIGFGNVGLWSTGTMFTLRHKFSAKPTN